jgi:DNA-binding IclR family transcriptional regulator
MELLAGHPDTSLALADICRELRISRSTCHVILHTLCASDWVLRDPVSGKYALGPAVAALSRQSAPLSRMLREPLHRFSRSIDMPVCISEIRSQSIVVVDSASPSGARPPVSAGLRLPFLAPFGREFVAWASAAKQKEWVDGSGPVNDVFRARIPKVLKEIRERGYGIERLTDPLLRVFIAMQALDDGNAPDPVTTRLAGAVTDLTVVDFLAGELTEAAPCPLATISAPIFDAAGHVVMSVSAQPYRQLTTEQIRDIGAQVMEFAQTAGSVVAQHSSAR